MGGLVRQVVAAAFIAVATAAVIVSGRSEPRPPAAARRAFASRKGSAFRRPLVAGAVSVVAVIAAVAAVGLDGGSAGASSSLVRAGLPGELVSREPWPRNVARLRARLDALGLPALDREGTALHAHQHIDVFVNGRRVPVPAGIGIDGAGRFISPIHTHDPSGVVHVESPVVRTFTLGQLFGVWGVRLTRRCLGAYCASPSSRLRVYVGGRPVTGDPRLLPLAPHAEIVVAYGTAGELPHPLPATYMFAAGL